MRALGVIFLIVGIGLLIYAISMETSVSTGLPGMERVHNIGLLQMQNNYLWVGSILALVGVLMAIFGGSKGKDEKDKVEKFSGPESSLSDPAYQLYLVKKFSIERNDTLQKFAFSGSAFDTLEEALKEADIEERRMEDEEKRKNNLYWNATQARSSPSETKDH